MSRRATVFAVVFCFMTCGAFAAEEQPTTKEAAEPVSSGAQETPADERTRPEDDVFRPSEDISEDLAVSYPVDI